MSLLLLRRHRHGATRREWRRVAPPPHVAIHDADADQEQQQQQQLVTHTILLPQFGLCLVYMPHASCCALPIFGNVPHTLPVELQLQLQIPPASNGCQTAARQGGLGQAGRARGRGGCCLGVHTIEVVHLAGVAACAPAPTLLPPPLSLPSFHSYVRSQTSWQTLQNKAKKM